MKDTTPRYTPGHVMIASVMKRCPVMSARSYPPGTHPKGCIIRQDCTAVELVTDHGSRWFGFDKARINSELRMVVQGFDSRDEVRSKWEPAAK